LADNNNGLGETRSFYNLPTLISDLSSIGWNDKVTSVIIHSDSVKFKIWVDANWDGHSIPYEGKGTYNVPGDVDNRGTSIKIWTGEEPSAENPNPSPSPSPSPSDPSRLVGFFDASAGETSDKWNYYRDIGNAKTASELGFRNDALSCVGIFDEDVVVELFVDDHYQGKSVKLEGRGKFDLRNYDIDNMVSSYKVYYRDQEPVSDPSPTQTPAPLVSYEVIGVKVDSSGNLNITVVNSTGQQAAVQWKHGPEASSYLVKFPDGIVSFYLNPDFGILALHSDKAFAQGDGHVNAGGAWEFLPGSTVVLSPNQSIWDATLWIDPVTTAPTPSDPEPSPTPTPSPDTDTDTDTDTDDKDGPDGPTFVLPEKITVSGGGCTTGTGFGIGGWIAVLLAVFALDTQQRTHRKQ
jgi:hypothetical protein